VCGRDVGSSIELQAENNRYSNVCKQGTVIAATFFSRCVVPFAIENELLLVQELAPISELWAILRGHNKTINVYLK